MASESQVEIADLEGEMAELLSGGLSMTNGYLRNCHCGSCCCSCHGVLNAVLIFLLVYDTNERNIKGYAQS